MSQPTIGRMVHYRLSETDAQLIEAQRTSNEDPLSNQARSGDSYPAVVVRTFGGPNVNLKVLLDGQDTYWATSRPEGDEPGQWQWPPRV